MDIYNSLIYKKEINDLVEENIDYAKLKNKSILVTGARGLIGSFFIDTIII